MSPGSSKLTRLRPKRVEASALRRRLVTKFIPGGNIFTVLCWLCGATLCAQGNTADSTASPPDAQIQTLDNLNNLRRLLPEVPLQPPQPPAPDMQLPPLPTPPVDQLSSGIAVKINTINVIGNTVFSNAELHAVVEPFEGRTLGTEDLLNLKNSLTRYYTKAGFINSGAVIPDQQVVDGTITIQIIEGHLTEISILSESWLRDRYIEDRLKIGNEDVLNINQLQRRIRLLHEDKLIKRINAELLPGNRPGESLLNLQIEENRLYNFGLSFNNFRTPSTGELQGEFYGSFNNITGFGDAIDASVALSEGLDNFSVAYSVPVSPYDTRLKIHYDQNDADIIEQPFDVLNINSKNTNFTLSAIQPWYIGLEDRIVASISYENRRSDVSFQIEGFPRTAFPSQAEDGRTRLSVVRFIQEWLHRSTDQVIAWRSSFSWGISASALVEFDQPTNRFYRINDNEFFSWLGQFQWVRRLTDSNIQAIFRTDAQLTPDSLLPIEKFSVGGSRTVRGYRENQMTRDNGVIASFEVRIPLFNLPLPGLSEPNDIDTVQLAAFYDFGWAENNFTVSGERNNTLSSAGLGVRWDPSAAIHGELYWAVPLNDVATSQNDSLQDQGIHFLLNIDLF